MHFSFNSSFIEKELQNLHQIYMYVLLQHDSVDFGFEPSINSLNKSLDSVFWIYVNKIENP